MRTLSGTRIRAFLFPALAALVSIVIATLINPLYGYVDNYSVAIVVNRLWDQNAYVHYLHPWLCALLSGLSDVLVHADAFSLFLHVLQFLCLYALLFLLWQSREIPRGRKLLGGLFVVSLYLFMRIFSANYTVVACFSAITGSMLLLSCLHAPSRLRTASGLLLLSAGIMLRSKGAFLALPYFLLEFLIQTLENRKKHCFLKRAAVTFSLVVLCAGVLLASKAVTDASDSYRASIQYSRLQSAVNDYPSLPYEAVKERLDGVSESEYRAVTRWITLDTETMNTDLYQSIENAHRGTTVLDTKGISFFQLVGQLAYFLYTNLHWTAFAGAILVLLIIRLALHSRMRAFYALSLIAGSIAIILYFGIKGRCNDRVWIPVVLCMLAYGLSPVIRMEKRSPVFSAAVCAILLAALGCTFAFSEFHSPAHALNARSANRNLVLDESPADNDTLYIWHNWHDGVSRKYADAGKLPSKEFLTHNLPAGEWFYGQVYFKNHLNAIGASNPARALFERENTYLLFSDPVPGYYAELFRDLYPEYEILPAFPVNTKTSTLTACRFCEKTAP